jgi:hypothetical protein
VAPSPKIVSGYGSIAGSDDFTANENLPTLANRTVQGVGGTINHGDCTSKREEHRLARGKAQSREPSQHGICFSRGW